MKLYGVHFNYDGNRQKGFIIYDKDFNKVHGIIELESDGNGRQQLHFKPAVDQLFTSLELNDIVVFMAKNRVEG